MLNRPRFRIRPPVWMLPVLVGALLGEGCTVGPNYQPPATSMPASWVDVAPDGESPGATASSVSTPVAQPADVRQWWTTFNDPVLNSLIDRSATANLDLRQAEARIRQARAARTVAGAGAYPTVDASASATRAHTGGSSGSAQTGNFYRAGFDAAWELDVFGGVRRGIEAADADLLFAEEDWRSVLVSLTAEVATTYADLRGAQQQLAIAKRNLQAQQQTASLTRDRFNAGFVGQLDVANAEAQAAGTSARIPTLEVLIRQSIYALGVLLGQEPGSLIAELSTESPLPPIPPLVPIGLPSDLLRRRPDIRRAEADLHAATAQIGVATADLFPKFSLTGSLGIQGSSISALGAVSNGFWSIGPSVTWPIFAGGQIRGNIQVKQAVTDEVYAAYQQTVLVALQEVENALISYSREQQRRDALSDSVRSNRQAVDLAMQLYTAGRTDFLNVISAQRGQFDAEDALAQSQTQLVTNLIALYKAIGGGWQEPDVTVSAAVSQQRSALDQGDPAEGQ